ncbi:hypothetical protein U91I_01189 [alpha proteobacterium U9-1i]|nr:hypothetical protein U91I_01189 [alpha proteobacterium U9-1i]
MLWALGVLALFAFEIFFPTPAEQLFSSILARQIGVDDPIDLGLIGNVIWIALLLFTVRYFQAAAYVERLYPYLHDVEARLNEVLGREFVTREGKAYLADYPKFQSWLAFLYQTAVPFLLFLLPTIRIALEFQRSALSISLAIDIGVYALFVWTTLRYVDMIHLRKKRKQRA